MAGGGSHDQSQEASAYPKERGKHLAFYIYVCVRKVKPGGTELGGSRAKGEKKKKEKKKKTGYPRHPGPGQRSPVSSLNCGWRKNFTTLRYSLKERG